VVALNKQLYNYDKIRGSVCGQDS